MNLELYFCLSRILLIRIYSYSPARIEAVCYYLSSPDTANSAEAPIYRQAMDHLVDEIAKSQGPDGYIGIYFRVSSRRLLSIRLRIRLADELMTLSRWSTPRDASKTCVTCTRCTTRVS